ncbi:chemotaxis-specific protein-glutamate methyltransferase CheB [Frigidibacter oleivorans]|uniref:chemotaxis-specific protein-glutamate methyltransferase CheB n=1 Tax=Frigidibacter oleivorans TaxID=2487129 RepID=UPI000F8D610A|nr:chemotaxis-specific protein-glutamate methyltransferase CheB [Frigidibacter oleivorans]
MTRRATPAAPTGGGGPVRVLVVDDSAMMREVLRQGLSRDPGIEVVGLAASAAQAAEMLSDRAVDVMTLDIEMPQLDGLSFLRQLMAGPRLPVVVVSSATQSGAAITLEAMEAGAVDIIGKPCLSVGTGLGAILPELCDRVRAAAGARVARGGAARGPLAAAMAPRPVRPAAPGPRPPAAVPQILGIGASTGGVQALFEVLAHLTVPVPPVVVVQHMPEGFTAAFARRLDAALPFEVAEAQDGEPLLPNRVLIAPGGSRHMRVEGRAPHWRVALVEGAPVSFSRPSVDVLFASLAERAGGLAGAALLTGMGSDGARGLAAIRRAGGMTIAQDEASSVVWGMPGAAVDLGAACQVLPLDRIARALAGDPASPPPRPARPAAVEGQTDEG